MVFQHTEDVCISNIKFHLELDHCSSSPTAVSRPCSPSSLAWIITGVWQQAQDSLISKSHQSDFAQTETSSCPLSPQMASAYPETRQRLCSGLKSSVQYGTSSAAAGRSLLPHSPPASLSSMLCHSIPGDMCALWACLCFPLGCFPAGSHMYSHRPSPLHLTQMSSSWVRAQSLHVQLCDPTGCGPLGSSAHGNLQARILEWVAMPSSRGSSPPRD